MNWTAVLLLVLLACASTMDMADASKKTSPKKKASTPKRSPPPTESRSPPSPRRVWSPPPPSPAPPLVETLGTPYAFEMEIRYDGLAPNRNGMVDPAETSAPLLAIDFMRNKVVNGGRYGGTDAQVNAFRTRAFEFFHERFGVEVPEDLAEKDLDDTIYLTDDTYIMPVTIGRDSGGKSPFFRNRDIMTYMDHANVEDAGFYMFVGAAGLPAGGTYNMSLLPGARVGFGAMVIDGGCPDLHLPLIKTGNRVCHDAYHAQGWLILKYQTEMPQYLMMHGAWNVDAATDFNYGSPTPAQMFPIHLTILPDDKLNWGTGSCHGTYYALVVNYDWFRLISNMVCTFTARTSWEYFFPEHEIISQ